MSFRLTRDAQQELTEVRRYTVQRWEQEQLTKYLQNLCGTVELQAEFPGQGSVWERAYAAFCTETACFSHRVEGKQQVIFAALHQRVLPTVYIQGR